MAGDTSRLVTIICPKCGTTREITYRTHRRIQRGELTGQCAVCPNTPKVTQRHRNYWLHPAVEADGRPIHPGYTLAEIRELAAGLEQLLRDHSRYAKPPAKREWDEAA